MIAPSVTRSTAGATSSVVRTDARHTPSVGRSGDSCTWVSTSRWATWVDIGSSLFGSAAGETGAAAPANPRRRGHDGEDAPRPISRRTNVIYGRYTLDEYLVGEPQLARRARRAGRRTQRHPCGQARRRHAARDEQ